jgi:hypothetical protein
MARGSKTIKQTTPPILPKSNNSYTQAFNNMTTFLANGIKNMNESKIFAGLMIIMLNIGSKFITIKLSPAVEAYLKYTFSRQILVFAIAWMGTRDIYIALFISILFNIFANYLLNEDSMFCCLPESFTDYHRDLYEKGNTPVPDAVLNKTNSKSDKVSDEDIRHAEEVLEKAKRQNTMLNYEKWPKV